MAIRLGVGVGFNIRSPIVGENNYRNFTLARKQNSSNTQWTALLDTAIFPIKSPYTEPPVSGDTRLRTLLGVGL